MQHALDAFALGADFIERRADVLQTLAAVAQKNVAGRGGAQAAGRADENRDADFGFDAF